MKAPGTDRSGYRRILYCTDFSEGARAAFAHAVGVALHRPDCELTLLHVIHEPDAQFWRSYLAEVDGVEVEARQAIEAKIEEDYRSRLPRGLELRVEIRVGADAEVILEFASEAGMDLIVMGRQGHGGAGRVLFGGVAAKVVRKALCAVPGVPATAASPSDSGPDLGGGSREGAGGGGGWRLRWLRG